MTSPFLDNYDPLDVIGNGSFGIIRKVRRKTDGLIFARKELNFERMSERDRKQIVAEVNILKDLHHDHIVRYHDRYVDRDAGILYILMEYCGGGDLSTVIKQATKQNRPIPEDTIWHYFLQILQALHHCHHPNGHSRSSSGSTINGGPIDAEGGSRRVQILHRDLKPDNVFLDENNTVKLGDFGLSKALAQASFASTYVGTPYYMSPELMQEKAYDSKSDIWSLGCLIYELCALKPPFHEAKTHSELSIFIRNGRIPPLPRGYSQALTSVIKSMLNLNPAMRPSAAQLLQHERLELFNRLADAEKMFSVVKAHRATVTAKEREILAREQTLLQNEQRLTSLLGQKDQEIASLQQLVSQLQQQQHQFSRHDVEVAVKQAVARREEELRVLVMKREEEVAVAIAKREEEIMEAVRNREAEVDAACVQREELIKKEVDERIQWVLARENELKAEETRLEELKKELEESTKKVQQQGAATTAAKGRKEKNPLEEVKNLLEPTNRAAQATPVQQQRRRKLESQPPSQPTPSTYHIASMETPISRPVQRDYMPSAMKGVVLTSTGEILATPSPAELDNLFNRSPKVGLNFGKIFDFEEGDSGEKEGQDRSEEGAASPPPSPSSRKEKEKSKDKDKEDASSETSTSSSGTSAANTRKQQTVAAAPPPTRIRRPSIRSSHRASRSQPATLPSSTSDPAGLNINGNGASTSNGHSQAKPLPHPHLRPSGSSSNLAAAAAAARSLPIPVPRSHPSPEYDFADEENLPSPFLKRVDKAAAAKAAAIAAASASNSNPPNMALSSGSSSGSKMPHSSEGESSSSSSSKVKRRGSSGLLLRAVAAANNNRRGTPSTSSSTSVAPPNANNIGMGGEAETMTMTSGSSAGEGGGVDARPSLASARKATEEARKTLLRQS
ncbi:hypothetical protein M413DRAFT_14052 [Hebeloma cylindrosporum]|uniref:non-specific serine/threonine protein kinase n=1 Tax=Hebeloma cylindrosporum TaxID=76867 RepID=A0A0C2XE72_HEBCY|nr:hypothetical protein M413DRAFT_14052 [Hebeloma cylindrosporum h7]